MEKLTASQRLKAGKWLKDECVFIQEKKDHKIPLDPTEKEILARFENQDPDNLSELERDLMNQCNAEENYEIARLYEAIDDDGDPNIELAVEFYKKAAEQDHTDAQYELATMYESGRCVSKDQGEALKWYKKAANRGHMDAHNALIILRESQESFDNKIIAQKSQESFEPLDEEFDLARQRKKEEEERLNNSDGIEELKVIEDKSLTEENMSFWGSDDEKGLGKNEKRYRIRIKEDQNGARVFIDYPNGKLNNTETAKSILKIIYEHLR